MSAVFVIVVFCFRFFVLNFLACVLCFALFSHSDRSRQAHLGDLEGLAKNEAMIDGVKFEPTKVS